MNNNERTVATGIREADEFFEKEGVAEAIQQFFETSKFHDLISEVYGKIILQIEKIQEDVPEELKEHAVNFWEEAKYDEEQFKSDVMGNMKLNLHMTIATLKDFAKELCSRELLLKSITQNDYEGLMRDAQTISKDISEKWPALYAETIYSEYVPKEIREEVEDFIKLFGGLGVVMITAVPKEVMDDLKEEDSVSGEGDSENKAEE